MDVQGILVKKTKEASGVSKRTGREWRTAEFLIEIPGRFAQKLIVQVRNTEGGRIAFFEKHIGMEVSVSFDFVAHEYEGNWYNQLDAWGIAPAKPAGNAAGTKIRFYSAALTVYLVTPTTVSPSICSAVGRSNSTVTFLPVNT